MNEKDEIVARCVDCYAQFTEQQIVNVTSCPGCGSVGKPMSPKQDVEIRINWHELRILTIWAENYAHSIRDNEDIRTNPVKTVWAIAGRIQEQFPSFPPLTLSGEIAQLKEKFKDVEISGNIPEGGPLPPKIS